MFPSTLILKTTQTPTKKQNWKHELLAPVYHTEIVISGLPSAFLCRT